MIRRLLVLVTLAVLLGAGACSDDRDEAAVPAEAGGGAVALVTLGGAETAGADLDFPAVVQERWTQRLYRDALPTRAIHVNAASRDRRLVHDGATSQLDIALEAEPTIATVWFGGDDVAAGTPVEDFAADLRTIVDGLTAAGAEVYLAVETGTPYDDVIDAVVSATGATPVPVSALPTPLGPSGHADAADRFADAIGEVP